MDKKVNPLAGRAAELNEYAVSDLSVEEQLAGGASVDDLVAAGVLHDDYDPENDLARFSTPEPTEEENLAGYEDTYEEHLISDEEFKTLVEEHPFNFAKKASDYRKLSHREDTWT